MRERAKEEQAILSVPITVEELADRAEEMSSIVHEIAAVKAQAKRKAIEAPMDRLKAHARVITEGVEQRKQGTLTLPQEQAATALRQVAAATIAACVCEDEDHADPSCVVHGVPRKDNGVAVDSSERHSEGCAAVVGGSCDCRAEQAANEEPDVEAEAAEAIGDPVDVGTVSEPASIAEHRAQRARERRAGGNS